MKNKYINPLNQHKLICTINIVLKYSKKPKLHRNDDFRAIILNKPNDLVFYLLVISKNPRASGR